VLHCSHTGPQTETRSQKSAKASSKSTGSSGISTVWTWCHSCWTLGSRRCRSRGYKFFASWMNQ
jgi:hypothetical protein